jgi:hypothetical protein
VRKTFNQIIGDNLSTVSETTIAVLLQDPDRWALPLAQHGPGEASQALTELSRHPDANVRRALAQRRTLPAGMRETLLGDKVANVAAQALTYAAKGTITGTHISALLARKKTTINDALLARKELYEAYDPEDLLALTRWASQRIAGDTAHKYDTVQPEMIISKHKLIGKLTVNDFIPDEFTTGQVTALLTRHLYPLRSNSDPVDGRYLRPQAELLLALRQGEGIHENVWLQLYAKAIEHSTPETNLVTHLDEIVEANHAYRGDAPTCELPGNALTRLSCDPSGTNIRRARIAGHTVNETIAALGAAANRNVEHVAANYPDATREILDLAEQRETEEPLTNGTRTALTHLLKHAGSSDTNGELLYQVLHVLRGRGEAHENTRISTILWQRPDLLHKHALPILDERLQKTAAEWLLANSLANLLPVVTALWQKWNGSAEELLRAAGETRN